MNSQSVVRIETHLMSNQSVVRIKIISMSNQSVVRVKIILMNIQLLVRIKKILMSNQLVVRIALRLIMKKRKLKDLLLLKNLEILRRRLMQRNLIKNCLITSLSELNMIHVRLLKKLRNKKKLLSQQLRLLGHNLSQSSSNSRQSSQSKNLRQISQ